MGSGKRKIPITQKEEAGEGQSAAVGETEQQQEQASSLDQRVIEEFEKELAEARRQADENWDKYLRAVAERENYKKRLARNFEERLRQDKRRLLHELLEVSDELERALAHADRSDGLVEGVKLTYHNLQKALSDEGVAQIDAVGDPFDPHYHEAVGVAEGDGDEEVVAEEVQKGYLYEGKLLRPAKVIVAKPENS